MKTNKKSKIRNVAVLTSGGDSPGMNAAIRAVVRMTHYYGVKCYGVLRGYYGLINDEFVEMGPRSVSNIIQRGGTILRTSRCKEFETSEGLKKAALNLSRRGIDALIAIGGNGTYMGAIDLGKIWKGKIIGVPGTIDNDLYGTDSTIGYDTAVNTALDAIDKLRDTADAHERIFLVEVMGRHAGFIGLETAIAGGAENVFIPETTTSIDEVSKQMEMNYRNGKTSSIVIVSEGDEEGNAFTIAKKLQKASGREYRVVVLGHLQRGGSPTAADRRLATELGAFAVEQARIGKTGVCVGRVGGKLVLTPLKIAVHKRKKLDSFLLKIFKGLAS